MASAGRNLGRCPAAPGCAASQGGHGGGCAALRALRLAEGVAGYPDQWLHGTKPRAWRAPGLANAHGKGFVLQRKSCLGCELSLSPPSLYAQVFVGESQPKPAAGPRILSRWKRATSPSLASALPLVVCL